MKWIKLLLAIALLININRSQSVPPDKETRLLMAAVITAASVQALALRYSLISADLHPSIALYGLAATTLLLAGTCGVAYKRFEKIYTRNRASRLQQMLIPAVGGGYFAGEFINFALMPQGEDPLVRHILEQSSSRFAVVAGLMVVAVGIGVAAQRWRNSLIDRECAGQR